MKKTMIVGVSLIGISIFSNYLIGSNLFGWGTWFFGAMFIAYFMVTNQMKVFAFFVFMASFESIHQINRLLN